MQSGATEPTTPPLTPTTTSPAWRYRTYANARFRFSLQVPATFVGQATPEDSDGRAFESPDHRAQVSAFGANNVLDDTVAEALKQCETLLRSDGGRVTYSFAQANFYICTGYTRDGSIFYERTVVLSHVEYSVQWTYARDLKTYLDPPVQHSVATFRAGPDQGE